MKRIVIATISVVIFTTIALVGCAPNTIDTTTEIEQLQAQIAELQDANERLADMYIDIEAENAELRDTNAALIADNAALASQPAQIEYVEVPANDEYIECGACGAHVHDWYYVRNMDDTAFVEVCKYCYESCLTAN